MLVQVARKRPLRSTDGFGTIFVLVHRVLGIKKALDTLYWKGNGDPVLRSAVRIASDAIVSEPVTNKLIRILSWLYKLSNIMLGQMLAITSVRRVRDYLG